MTTPVPSAAELVALALPLRDRLPIPYSGHAAPGNAATLAALKDAVALPHGRLTLSDALACWRALDAAGEDMSENNPALAAIDALLSMLDDFLFTAPAATLADALARIDRWQAFTEASSTADSVAAIVYEAMRSDLTRLATGMPAPASAMLGGWVYVSPFTGMEG